MARLPRGGKLLRCGSTQDARITRLEQTMAELKANQAKADDTIKSNQQETTTAIQGLTSAVTQLGQQLLRMEQASTISPSPARKKGRSHESAAPCDNMSDDGMDHEGAEDH